MKLNAASEMEPVSWPGFANMHPFQPQHQCEGYKEMIDTLNDALCEITRFAAVSTQPNSGAAGEYAGLVAITRYLKSIVRPPQHLPYTSLSSWHQPCISCHVWYESGDD